MTSVLIIEDTEDNRVLIKRLLEKSGYETLIAEDGQTGLDIAIEKSPGFILLDIQLPDMDGTEVLKKLRQDETTKSIPVIVVTSYAMAGDRERLVEAGCDGYLEKPIDPSKVINQIETILEDCSRCG